MSKADCTDKALVVGIDLGTTNSLVGTVVEGKTTLFADKAGKISYRLLSGWNANKKRLLVGRVAKNRRIIDPQGTVVSVKRLMGQDTTVRVGDRQLSPSEVSALILSSLLDRVQEQLGKRPGRAIITVPAYFNDAQREATKTAGELAGLTVERLVNEPTAAAMTFQTGQEARVLAYDFGGGTFDVSVLERDEGFLEVKASRGDTQLGGDDIDRALCELVLERLGENQAIVRQDRQGMTRLIECVERAKIILLRKEETRIFDPFLAGEGANAVHLDMPITRADVELAARPFVTRTLKCIDEALQDAKISATQLDRVLLVGGTSKMPLVAQKMVGEHLKMPVFPSDQADRAVALGASILAGRASGQDVQEILVDITPHSLRIGTMHGPRMYFESDDELYAHAIIPKDTVIPVRRTETFFTVVQDQERLQVPVVQGEHELVGGNTYLGDAVIDDMPPSPESSPVQVTFELDLSGVLHVTAKHMPSGVEGRVSFVHSPYRLTEQKRKAAMAQVQQLESTVERGEIEQADDADLSLARAMVSRATKALQKVEGQEKEEAVGKLKDCVKELNLAIDAKSITVGELTDKVSDALLDLF